MKNKHSSKKDYKETFWATIVISLILLFALSFLFILYFFSSLGIFHLLNIQFDSFLSILFFIFLYFFVGIISELFVGALILLMKHSGKYNRWQQQLAVFILYFLTNWAIISFLDFVMHSIKFGLLAIIILALTFTLIEYLLQDFEEDEK